ncbi:hypothetical protein [Actinophytocola sp.]|uniref:hypothetical protein n=1 Tax=Actinophytocola sp. TaxID=1872138 RepID=UPI002ED57E71
MTTDHRATETAVSRWAGTPWFVAGGLVVVIAVIMLVTPVSGPARYGEPGCGIAVKPGGGSDDYALQTEMCVAARGERWTASLAVLTIGGFLVIPGLMRRSGRYLDGPTAGGLALLALASALLLLPQSDDRTDAWCGSALIPTSPGLLSPETDTDQRLAECAGRRSSRVAWTIVPAAAGIFLMARRRPAPDSARM